MLSDAFKDPFISANVMCQQKKKNHQKDKECPGVEGSVFQLILKTDNEILHELGAFCPL